MRVSADLNVHQGDRVLARPHEEAEMRLFQHAEPAGVARFL